MNSTGKHSTGSVPGTVSRLPPVSFYRYSYRFKRVPLCARVSRTCPVCVPAPPARCRDTHKSGTLLYRTGKKTPGGAGTHGHTDRFKNTGGSRDTHETETRTSKTDLKTQPHSPRHRLTDSLSVGGALRMRSVNVSSMSRWACKAPGSLGWSLYGLSYR